MRYPTRVYQDVFKENPYVSRVPEDDERECINCGAVDTYRIQNSLLDTSNPQCLNQGECGARRRDHSDTQPAGYQLTLSGRDRTTLLTARILPRHGFEWSGGILSEVAEVELFPLFNEPDRNDTEAVVTGG